MKQISLGLILLFSLSAYAKEPSINVLIGRSLKNIYVSGVDLKNKLFFKKSAKKYSGRKSLKFNCDPKSKSMLPKRPVKLASVASETGLINWMKDKFKGKMHIISSQQRNGCDLVNEVKLEDYLATLLPKEMSASWPIEALKAQAVAARSYALYKLKTQQVSKDKGFEAYYDLENSEKHQVNGTFFDATRSTYRATQETRGEVLSLHNGKIVEVFFHSKCGGKTMKPDQVWANSVPGYESVPCPFCHDHGHKEWSIKLKKSKLERYLNKAMTTYDELPNGSVSQVRIMRDNSLNSRIKFYSRDNFLTLKKSRLRSAMGREQLPSNNFFIKEGRNSVLIRGKGYGHGVGMCQFGAKELAKQGFDYKQILAHYFPSFKLTKLY